jgi:hypothetical protein
MTYVPGGPRPAGPLPEIATARQEEVAREVARQHGAREAREAGKQHRAKPWWKRLFSRQSTSE